MDINIDSISMPCMASKWKNGIISSCCAAFFTTTQEVMGLFVRSRGLLAILLFLLSSLAFQRPPRVISSRGPITSSSCSCSCSSSSASSSCSTIQEVEPRVEWARYVVNIELRRFLKQRLLQEGCDSSRGRETYAHRAHHTN